MGGLPAKASYKSLTRGKATKPIAAPALADFLRTEGHQSERTELSVSITIASFCMQNRKPPRTPGPVFAKQAPQPCCMIMRSWALGRALSRTKMISHLAPSLRYFFPPPGMIVPVARAVSGSPVLFFDFDGSLSMAIECLAPAGLYCRR